MEPRNLNRPSYVLALLLGFIAIVDAFNAILGLQSSDACSRLSSSFGLSCGNPGWFIDLMTAGVSAALLALLLMRPHLYVFTGVVAWSGVAFLANLVMRESPGIDGLATIRMAIYFITLVVAGVPFVFEGQQWLEAERAKRPVAPVGPVPVWTGTGWAFPYGPPPMTPYGAPLPVQPPAAPWVPQPAFAPPAPAAAPVAEATPIPEPVADVDASAIAPVPESKAPGSKK